jgi:hypothetical protein
MNQSSAIALNDLQEERSKQRIIVVTVSLDEKLTENDEAYEKLISSLINWHDQS